MSWRKSTRHRDDSAIGKGVWGWMVGRPASSAAELRLELMPDTLVSKKFASSFAAAAALHPSSPEKRFFCRRGSQPTLLTRNVRSEARR